MSQKKKRVVLVLVIAAFLASWLVSLKLWLDMRHLVQSDGLIGQNIEGTVKEYVNISDGTVVILDGGYTDWCVLLTKDTMYSGDEVRQKLAAQEIGLHLSIRSEYRTITPSAVNTSQMYPATVVWLLEEPSRYDFG